MDDVANYADHVNILEGGHLVRSGHPKTIFQDVAFMKSKQLGVPKITQFAQDLVDRGLKLENLPITIEEFVEVITHG